MGYRSGKRDMSDTLTAHAGLRYLNAAAVTDNTFVSDFFVFTTMALPVLGRSKDSFAVQTVLLRF